jgi:predicted RecA/RadA family phage recombinase
MAAQVLEAVYYRGDEQNRFDHVPGADIANGKVVDIGNAIGVCTSPEGIKAGAMGSLARAGVFKLRKAEGTGVVFAQHAKVFWDTVNFTAVAAAGANIVYAGMSDEAAVTGDNHVKTEINAINPQAQAET